MSPVDLPYSCKAFLLRTIHENVLYSFIFKWKSLHSIIVEVSDIEMAMTIEGQTSGIMELICSCSRPVSTHHDSARWHLTTPAHHSLISRVCHVDFACRIDLHSVRRRQLRQTRPLTSSIRYNNSFFGALHPLHHAMIFGVWHVDSVFSIYTDVDGVIELIQGSTSSISTRHDGRIRLSSAIADYFMLLDVSDIERSFIIHRQSVTSDVVDNRFSASWATSTRPTRHSTIPCVTDDETVGFFVEDHIHRRFQLIRSISLSVATSQHCATRSTSLPFHDAVIRVVSNDHRVLVIDKETHRQGELVCLTPLTVSSSNSVAVLCPPSVGCNETKERRENKRSGWG